MRPDDPVRRAALEAEVKQYIVELAAARDDRGHRMVVRNGLHQPRTVVTAAGSVDGCADFDKAFATLRA